MFRIRKKWRIVTLSTLSSKERFGIVAVRMLSMQEVASSLTAIYTSFDKSVFWSECRSGRPMGLAAISEGGRPLAKEGDV